MAGKRSAQEVLDEWEQKMKEKAAQAAGMASGAYDQVTQGGVEPDARKLAQAAYLPKGVTVAPGSPMEAKMPGLMARDAAGAQGYTQGASSARGAQDIYDQLYGASKQLGQDIAGGAQALSQDAQSLGQNMAGGAQAIGQDLQGLLSGGSYADAPAQQAAPPAQVDPDRAASEQVIMQKLMSMSPEERDALVQKLQQQAGGM
jgi:hypothetical protein